MFVLPLEDVKPRHAAIAGGKAVALARLCESKSSVPAGLVITTDAYHEFVQGSGLKNTIRRELTWRPIDQMRWEEMWDASLRIRNAFLRAPVPGRLRRSLLGALKGRFDSVSVAVRSTAPGEDSTSQSFAGLHDSYLNIQEPEAILEHVKLVWASLWSDGAILYRKELNLDIEKSSMAVLVQEFISGSRSGVVFGQHPLKPDCVAIESVHGLNQGLVDGMVQPDSWALDRGSGAVVEFSPAERSSQVVLAATGVSLRPLPPSKAKRPPLSERDIARVYRTALDLEAIFRAPQDVEWTFKGSRFHLLQSRAITATSSPEKDNRAWYLTLRRSVANLEELRERIENDFVPKMEHEARSWQETRLDSLSTKALLKELDRRFDCYRGWVDRYWEECIPFAHGVRLFGQFYNDTLRPDDPYEFVELLAGGRLLSVDRNDALEALAAQVRDDPNLRAALERFDLNRVADTFLAALDPFAAELADKTGMTKQEDNGRRTVVALLLEMARRPEAKRGKRSSSKNDLEQAFLAMFSGADLREARDLLDLARASYRLRDDDNIYLGRIARQVGACRDEAMSRKLRVPKRIAEGMAMRPTGGQRHAKKSTPKEESGFSIKGRQLPGQPGGPGFASGIARIVRGPADLYAFKSGEVLVCDSLDPNMTFVLPLVSAIVECRGGMLVHGAIIAREYGIPCVTGVTDALGMIATGNRVQVDGYLGLVTID